MSKADQLRDRFFAGVPRYRWLKTVGQGGSGLVFKAHDLDLDELVAIKVLLPQPGRDDQELLARFKREIHLNRKIKHPNVARIHDFGISGDYVFLTMEFIPGDDLRTLVEKEGGQPIDKALSILRQIALGTHAAHKLGIVHRDLKSPNILVDENGAVAILDFGLATGMFAGDRKLTVDSVVMGTPQYMPPEQALGKALDARSDIYSIGIIAFEVLTGAVPFEADSPIAIALKHVSEPVPELPATFPQPLRAVIYKSLQKNPADRHTTAVDFEAELSLVQQALKGGSAPRLSTIEPPQLSAAQAHIATEPMKRIRVAPPEPPVFPRPEAPAAPMPMRAPQPAHAPENPGAWVLPSPRPPEHATMDVLRNRAPVILIANDDNLERKMAAASVAHFGWKTVEVRSGHEVLDMLMKSPADLLLLDVTMPGMDGYDVTRIVRSQPSLTATPIVLTAPRVSRSEFAFGIQTGANDYLQLPTPPEALVGRLWKILQHRGFTSPEADKVLQKALETKLSETGPIG